MHTQPKKSGLVVAIAIAIATLICGVVVTFVMAPREQSAYESISRLSYLTADQLAAMPPGKEVLFTGVFDGNEPLEHDLIIYERYEWEVDPWDEKDPVWQYLDAAAPSLTVLYQGQTFTVEGAGSVPLGGLVHEFIDQGLTSADGASFNGEYLYDGAIRFRGFMNGDTVTVHATKTGNNTCAPISYTMGTREDLVASMGESSSMTRSVGVMLMVCAPVIAGLALAIYFFRHR